MIRVLAEIEQEKAKTEDWEITTRTNIRQFGGMTNKFTGENYYTYEEYLQSFKVTQR